MMRVVKLLAQCRPKVITRKNVDSYGYSCDHLFLCWAIWKVVERHPEKSQTSRKHKIQGGFGLWIFNSSSVRQNMLARLNVLAQYNISVSWLIKHTDKCPPILS